MWEVKYRYDTNTHIAFHTYLTALIESVDAVLTWLNIR